MSVVWIEVSTRRSRYDAGVVPGQVRRPSRTNRRADADGSGTVERVARGPGAGGARSARRTAASIRRAGAQVGGDRQLSRSAHLPGRGFEPPIATKWIE